MEEKIKEKTKEKTQEAKEITKESESYLIINEEGTILDSKSVSRLIDEMKR